MFKIGIIYVTLNNNTPLAAFFIINENGNLTGMKVRDSEVTVQAEYRVEVFLW